MIGYETVPLGLADDLTDTDGVKVLDFLWAREALVILKQRTDGIPQAGICRRAGIRRPCQRKAQI